MHKNVFIANVLWSLRSLDVKTGEHWSSIIILWTTRPKPDTFRILAKIFASISYLEPSRPQGWGDGKGVLQEKTDWEVGRTFLTLTYLQVWRLLYIPKFSLIFFGKSCSCRYLRILCYYIYHTDNNIVKTFFHFDNFFLHQGYNNY